MISHCIEEHIAIWGKSISVRINEVSVDANSQRFRATRVHVAIGTTGPDCLLLLYIHVRTHSHEDTCTCMYLQYREEGV